MVSYLRELRRLPKQYWIIATNLTGSVVPLNLMEDNVKTQLSHELMTPLHQILGMAQLTHVDSTGEQVKEHYKILMETGEGLTAKLVVLLESSRFDDMEDVLNKVKKVPFTVSRD